MDQNILNELRKEALLFARGINEISEEIRNVELFLQELNINIPFTADIDNRTKIEWTSDCELSKKFGLVLEYIHKDVKYRKRFIETPREIRVRYEPFLKEFLILFRDHIQLNRIQVKSKENSERA